MWLADVFLLFRWRCFRLGPLENWKASAPFRILEDIYRVGLGRCRTRGYPGVSPVCWSGPGGGTAPSDRCVGGLSLGTRDAACHRTDEVAMDMSRAVNNRSWVVMGDGRSWGRAPLVLIRRAFRGVIRECRRSAAQLEGRHAGSGGGSAGRRSRRRGGCAGCRVCPFSPGEPAPREGRLPHSWLHDPPSSPCLLCGTVVASRAPCPWTSLALRSCREGAGP